MLKTRPKTTAPSMLPFLALSEVEKLTALPRADLKALVAAGKFPQPIQIAGSSSWVWSGLDVEIWRQQAIADGLAAGRITDAQLAEAFK